MRPSTCCTRRSLSIQAWIQESQSVPAGQMSESLTVRIVLHYYAKTLFIQGDSPEARAFQGMLIATMDRVASRLLAPASQETSFARDYWMMSTVAGNRVAPADGPRVFRVTLGRVSGAEHYGLPASHIITEVANDATFHQMALAVVSLIDGVRPHLGPRGEFLLATALMYVNVHYRGGVDCADETSFRVLPLNALLGLVNAEGAILLPEPPQTS